jgi:hypothetical protein
VGLHVERRLEARVPQQLGRLERGATIVQGRLVSVPERMPRYPWQPDPIARWCELPVVEVFVV